jgi:ABC-type multidrug transport system fused ATPase/permease subunit
MNFKIEQIIFLVLTSFWLFVILKVTFFHFFTVKNWLKTKGVIIEYDVKWFRSKIDTDHEGWKEMITYKYQVNSKEYHNNVISKNIGFIAPFKSFAKNNDLKKNEIVEITYDPNNPQNSVLITKFNPFVIILSLIAIIFSTCIIF